VPTRNIQIGKAGEYLAASYLARIFDEVLHTGESCRYDYLVTSEQGNFKIQVKTTEYVFDHHTDKWVRWDIKKKKTGSKEYRTYDPKDVDIFAFVCLPIDKAVFVANHKLGKTFQKKLSYLKKQNTIGTLENAIAIAKAVR